MTTAEKRSRGRPPGMGNGRTVSAFAKDLVRAGRSSSVRDYERHRRIVRNAAPSVLPHLKREMFNGAPLSQLEKIVMHPHRVQREIVKAALASAQPRDARGRFA